MTATVKLLVPTAPSTVEASQIQDRPAAIHRLAFLHNGQPHYDAIAPDLLAVLKTRSGLTVHEYRKPQYGRPAEAAVLDEIARTSEVALVGLAC
ncbi:MAG TPA: hypothetical protein VIA61_13415 [Methylomirabilota bacterium]|jgi:hypothetical protein